MPDMPELKPLKENLALLNGVAVDAEAPKDLLSREAFLLGGGIKDGFVDRLNQARENPGTTALEIGGAALVGAGLTAMSLKGGRWGTAAKIGIGTLELLTIGDGIRRAAPTLYAIGDTAINPENYSENRATVARYLGSACFDYPAMAFGGMVGSSAAARFMPRTVVSLSESFSSNNNPYFDKTLNAKNPLEGWGKNFDPIWDAHEVPGHHGGPKPLAHENPPGAWQQPVPEGSNVNWLNSIPEVNAPKAAEIAKPATPIKAHENAPDAWQKPVPEGSNVRWLDAGKNGGIDNVRPILPEKFNTQPKSLSDVLANWEPPKYNFHDITVQKTSWPLAYPAIWSSWTDERKVFQLQK
jgi:hypothetical protein